MRREIGAQAWGYVVPCWLCKALPNSHGLGDPLPPPTHFPGVTIVNQAAMAVSCPATAPPATKPPAQESRTNLYGAPTVYLACAKCREEKAAEKQKL